MSKGRTEEEKIAALIVDMQGDFTQFKDGSLAVPGTGGDYVDDVETAARLLGVGGFLVIGTKDWHPPGHVSFSDNHENKVPGDVVDIDGRRQILWPIHCVQGTDKARVVIDGNLFFEFVEKGSRPAYDSYSGFQDEGGNETGLDVLLRGHGIKKVVIFGLATDYCVKYTVLDGIKRGYTLIVVDDLCRGITPESTAAALQEMADQGAVILKALDVETIKAVE